jgi:hypothetical protein
VDPKAETEAFSSKQRPCFLNVTHPPTLAAQILESDALVPRTTYVGCWPSLVSHILYQLAAPCLISFPLAYHYCILPS